MRPRRVPPRVPSSVCEPSDQTITPAFCTPRSPGHEAMPPMAPASGWASAAAMRASSHPGSICTSSWTIARNSPVANERPALQPPAKPRLAGESTVRRPLTSAAAARSSSLGPFSVATTSSSTSRQVLCQRSQA